MLVLKARAENQGFVSPRFTQSCHSGLTSQSDPPADPTERWEGSSGCQSSGSAPPEVCLCAACAPCCVVERAQAIEAVMVSEGPLSPDGEEWPAIVSEGLQSPDWEEGGGGG